VTGRLVLRLVDEELDLLDLALEVGSFLRQARGEIRGRVDLLRRRALGRVLGRRGCGFGSDLSPPAS
jgi:hypothetical protein